MKNRLSSIWLLAALLSTSVFAEELKPGSNAWLLDAETDTQRFERLQNYLGGFSGSMSEVGRRYISVHEALSRDNFELASYHWEKIQAAIRNGYMKRPARQENADALFLNTVWEEVNNAFRSKDSDMAWAGFARAQQACMACHAAEDVAFMNDQSLFELGRPE